MFTLENDLLSVTVLDPLADRQHLWTRYCHGGYIFQITDRQRGPLLAGPEYPGPFSPFDGQGIPDAFNLGPLAEPGSGAAQALLIGIGLCDLRRDQVLEYCAWEVELAGGALRFGTRQTHQSYGLELERTVSLAGRTVRSTTRLRNIGQRPIPLVWFPHPFFPPPADGELCRLNVPVRLPENGGYALAANGWIRRAGPPGCYQPLDHDARTNLIVLQRHPVIGLAVGTCSYVPAFFPIWGNARTFSWEPFLERTVAAGQAFEWWIDYDF